MDSQFGLLNLWTQSDLVTRSTALLLLGMSVLTWIVIIAKALNLRRFSAQSRAVEAFWRASDFNEALKPLGADPNNPFRTLALEGREATAHHRAQPQLHDSMGVSDWLTRSLRNATDESTARLQSGLAVLASVGSTAPFVGLFGTVWGIYHALITISSTGQASINKVAGPIGEALIMTAMGLAVAIPAVLGYNALVRGNKSALMKLSRFSHDLHAYFVSGARVASGSAKVLRMRKEG